MVSSLFRSSWCSSLGLHCPPTSVCPHHRSLGNVWTLTNNHPPPSPQIFAIVAWRSRPQRDDGTPRAPLARPRYPGPSGKSGTAGRTPLSLLLGPAVEDKEDGVVGMGRQFTSRPIRRVLGCLLSLGTSGPGTVRPSALHNNLSAGDRWSVAPRTPTAGWIGRILQIHVRGPGTAVCWPAMPWPQPASDLVSDSMLIDHLGSAGQFSEPLRHGPILTPRARLQVKSGVGALLREHVWRCGR